MKPFLFFVSLVSVFGLVFFVPQQASAQTYSTTQCVTTNVGTPQNTSGGCGSSGISGGGTLGDQIAAYTTQLKNAIVKACPQGNKNPTFGYVNGNDNGCQNTIRQSRGGQFEDKVINQFQRMPLQCVMFVYGLSLHFNKPILIGLNAVSEGRSQPGYKWYPVSQYGLKDLQPGDFMVYFDNTLSSFNPGHMVVVVRVNQYKRSYDVIDANWDFNGSVYQHTIPWATSNGIISMSGWLRMQ